MPETSETLNNTPAISIMNGGELNDFQKRLSNLTIHSSNSSNSSNQSNQSNINLLPGQRKKNINFIL
jgi:hypothetical protein